ncbi:hypothetical protein GPL21_05860 [Bradyrhizobium pachyrhizi]|uniref:Uncharacterized protein n=1 Tax=Bradyrhizobium pachyrhizi TaxID=280333 RepID=A0A844SKP3_9BRAD|nr:hypothetical protein [Bradyrhizobium pachyrhizi]MVT64639.1 hypothetical protein [Bradyrhizobium pachyrhizi]
MDIFAEAWPGKSRDPFLSVKAICGTPMKNAALFALGLLAAGVLFHDSARCQTSLAQPLSLAPPPLSEQGAAPPAAAPTNSVWPPMAAPSVSPPRAAGKRPTSSAKSNVGSSPAMDDVPPPAETAKGSVPPRAAKDVPPPASGAGAPPSATVKDTPSASDDVSPAPVIDRLPPLAKPATDYDGFSVGIVDDNDASSRTTRPVRSRPAKQSKRGQEADRVSGQQSVDPTEDDKLKGKLTICRGCK